MEPDGTPDSGGLEVPGEYHVRMAGFVDDKKTHERGGVCGYTLASAAVPGEVTRAMEYMQS